jgi:hypothetical protein
VTAANAGGSTSATSGLTAEVYYAVTGSYTAGSTWSGGTSHLQCTHDGLHNDVRVSYAIDTTAPSNLQTDVYAGSGLLASDLARFAAAGHQEYTFTYTTGADSPAAFTVEGGAYDPLRGPLFVTYILPAQTVYC